MAKKQYRVRCQKLDEQGRGIVSFNHSMIPVPGLLPGELAEIELYRRGEESLGRLNNIIEKSSDRVENFCIYAKNCGGCQLGHLKYESQLAYKRDGIEALFGQDAKVPGVIKMAKPYEYRHKIHATLGRDKRGHIVYGIYEEASHHLVPIKKCRIQHPLGDQIMHALVSVMTELRIKPYDEDRQTGQIRHALIRVGYATQEVMVVLVVAELKFPQAKDLTRRLIKACPQITTLVLNRNNKKTGMVLGEEEFVAYGKGYIEDVLCGKHFRISPKSFYQVNPQQAERLYETAISMAEFKKTDKVLDAYCGTGTITLIAAPYVDKITGVELNSGAIKDARENAQRNGVTNARFYAQDAGKFMQQQAREKKRFDVVMLDPPRRGCTPDFLAALVKLAPEKVVYISCNPVTQARDVEYLKNEGYVVRKVQSVDLFAQTAHAETCVLLSYKNSQTSPPSL